MRIGTWNLEGRGGAAQVALLREQACDVWLLTEVPEALVLDGLERVAATGRMTGSKLWAAVYGPPGKDLGSPHPATAVAEIDGWTFASSILPWRAAGGAAWPGSDHAGRTVAALDDLRTALVPGRRLVWGGDWNHGLTGPEKAGSRAGRDAISSVLAELGLEVPTAGLPHRITGLASIDHVAVPVPARSAVRVDATQRSDHDAYVVEVDLPG